MGLWEFPTFGTLIKNFTSTIENGAIAWDAVKNHKCHNFSFIESIFPSQSKLSEPTGSNIGTCSFK
eukprot:CAMPEP_0195524456 /NCGR_PEP_ID=MMETSP0794_2-20130614/24297_1 /TAXON_ID=515487 /ORGANISM="Stephanopyxis turris, Strain CCMP 815" /LENGTH=65 /DNA_ID=CAMNT_0040654679 /DNA_START=385 /DNA_END=579 /DNA_ORIENTATION=-